MLSMGCLKLTYQNLETPLKVVYKKLCFNENTVQLWLSVDPMSDMYPSTSPYAYVENNPIMFVDPNGMLKDGFEVDGKGDLTKVDDTGGDDHDIIYSNNADGSTNKDVTKALKVDKGVIKNKETRDINKTFTDENGNKTKIEKLDLYKIDDDAKAKEFFEFMANNTDVEWSHNLVEDKKRNIITTSHDHDTEIGGNNIFLKDGYTFRGRRHSHPVNINASGDDMKSVPTYNMQSKTGIINHYIYHKGKYYQFNNRRTSHAPNQIPI